MWNNRTHGHAVLATLVLAIFAAGACDDDPVEPHEEEPHEMRLTVGTQVVTVSDAGVVTGGPHPCNGGGGGCRWGPRGFSGRGSARGACPRRAALPPPSHPPPFVLPHRPRPPIEMDGGTTFHFIDASPAEALETAREAAGGQDVRLGGGPTTIRDFLAAGLVDHAHIVVVPILLGRGVRLWDGLEDLDERYDVEATSSPSGVTHVTFTRAVV